MTDPTYKLIDKTTLNTSQSSIEFTSISSDYTDLILKVSARSSRSDNNDPLIIEFNGSTTGYSMQAIRGTGAAVQGISDSSIWTAAIPASTATSNVFGNVDIYIANYKSTIGKSISSDGVGENNDTNAYAILSAGSWDIATDVAITTIKLYAQNGNLVQYSSAYLYGIKNS